MSAVGLAGHKDGVLCLAALADAQSILSGSEDGTVRIWDPNTRKGIRCLSGFHGEPVTSIAVAANNYHVWASAGSQAFLFDLRRPEVVLKQPDAIVSQNSDEINRIVIHPKGDYIAACDDSGEVKLFEPIRHSLVRTLRSKHTNLCTSLAFRPKSGHQIVSGGMDCQVVIWDTSNGRAQHSFSTNDASSGSGVNPPFVHSLDMAVSGDECAFGLGNADVLLYSLKNRSEIKRLRGHTSPVAVVHFAHFDENLLFSAGNDRSCVLWDLSRLPGGSAASVGSVSTVEFSSQEQEVFDTALIRARFTCAEKPNALLSVEQSLYVADAGNVIAVHDVTRLN